MQPSYTTSQEKAIVIRPPLAERIRSLGGVDSLRAQLLAAGLECKQRGFSIIPIGDDKEPLATASGHPLPWKRYQRQVAVEATIRGWFHRPGVTGLAVVLGPVSSDLAARDFDKLYIYDEWAQAHSDLAMNLPTVQTHRGRHVLFTCPGLQSDAGDDGELRAAGDYIVLPPSMHPSGTRYEWVNPLPPIGEPIPTIDPYVAGLWPKGGVLHKEVHKEVLNEVLNEDSDEVGRKAGVPAIAATCVFASLSDRIQDAFTESLPNEQGQRHKAIFTFVRILKSPKRFPEFVGTTAEQHFKLFQEWHQLALPNIGTKDFIVSWDDFTDGWGRMRVAAGEGPLDIAIGYADSADLPPVVTRYNVTTLNRLAGLCIGLQQLAGAKPFYLSARKAAKFLGLSGDANAFVTMARYLRLLVKDRVLELVVRGELGRGASYYRWIGGGK